jgi:hypothetical protein
MDVDVWVRRIALATLPLIALAIYFCQSDPPQPEEATSVPSASGLPASHDGIPELGKTGVSAKDLGAKGEAALAGRGEQSAGDTTASPSPELPPPPKRTRAPQQRAAVDLPQADGFGSSASNDHSAPVGPCGGIEARLITLSDDKDWTFASLALPGEPASIKHIGDRIGNYRLAKIEWDRVWLHGAGSRCAIGMHVGARAAVDELGAEPGADAVLDDAPRKPPPWSVPQEIATAIEKINGRRYEIDRGVVGGLYERGGDLLSGMKIMPVLSKDSVVGISLRDIKKDSLLDRFGVEDGDMLVAINGEPCTTLDGTLEALESARKSDRLLASLDRTGKRYQLEVVAVTVR